LVNNAFQDIRPTGLESKWSNVMENGSPKIIKIDGAELISAMRASSKGRLENLLTKYRKAGFSDRQIAEAMWVSPRTIDVISKLR